MSPVVHPPVCRALAAALLLAGAARPLGAQVAAEATPSVIARAAGAVRRSAAPSAPTLPPIPVTVARGAATGRDWRRDVAHLIPVAFTFGAAAIGGAAGAIHRDACFGDGQKMAGRAVQSGVVLSIPALFAFARHASEEGVTMRPRDVGDDRSARRELLSHPAIAFPVGGALFGAALGTPIGAVQGARHPERCGGGVGGGIGRGAGQMAVGGAIVGTGLALLAGALLDPAPERMPAR